MLRLVARKGIAGHCLRCAATCELAPLKQLLADAQQLTSMPVCCAFRRIAILGAACLLLCFASTSCSRRGSALERAEFLEQQERWEDALAAYNRVLTETKPSQTDAQSELYSHIGRCLIELGRGTDALVSLEKALALDGNNPNAHLRIAQLFVMADAPQQAESHLAYVAALRADDPDVLQVRAAMYAAQDHPDLAERDLLRAYDLAKDRDPIAERLAQLYLGSNQPDKARAILARSLEKSVHKSQLLLTLARLEETEGNSAQAEAAYRKAAAIEDTTENNERLAQFLARNGQIADAENILRKVDSMRPASPTALADLQFVTGRPQEALRSYESTYGRLSASPSPSSHSPVPAEDLRNIAVRIIETDLAIASQGERSSLAAARRHLDQASPNLDSATHNILESEIALVSGDLTSAERAANGAMQNQQSAAPAQYILGLIAARRGEESNALNHWQSALEADQTYIPARLSLAGQAVDQADGAKAEEYVIDVVRDEPANVTALLLYSRALLLQKRFDSAEALCERARSADPGNSQVAIILGDIALQQQHLALALLQYEKAMLLEPKSEDAIQGLTAVYRKGGANRLMLRKLEALAQHGGSPSSRLMEITGRLYLSQGMYADATRCLKRAVEMDPNRSSAVLALAGAYVDGNKEIRSKELFSQPGLQKLRDHNQNGSDSLLAALQAVHRGDVEQAIHRYEAAVRAGDPSGIASNNLAWIYATQGKNLDRALQLAQHALELNPGSPQILDTLGVIQVEHRQFTQAIASFQSGARRASELKGAAGLQHTLGAHLAEARELAGQPAVRE